MSVRCPTLAKAARSPLKRDPQPEAHRTWGLGLRVSGFRVSRLRFRVLRSRVLGLSGLRLLAYKDLGFRVAV